MIGASISAMPLVKAGRIRAIAVTRQSASKPYRICRRLRKVEAPGYEMVGWFGMFAGANAQGHSGEAKHRSKARLEPAGFCCQS